MYLSFQVEIVNGMEEKINKHTARKRIKIVAEQRKVR